MSRVDLSAPPHSSFATHRAWLHYHFFDHLCSYCSTQNTGTLETEHYEPKKYAEHRIDDPTNFLLACGRCNGSGCKGDYHPEHDARRTRSRDSTGFLVLDVREDNPAELFGIQADGQISPRQGPQHDRAAWNISILKLSLEFLCRRRAETFALLGACEHALAYLAEGREDADLDHMNAILDLLLPRLAGEWLFVELYEIGVSKELADRVESIREEGRRQLFPIPQSK